MMTAASLASRISAAMTAAGVLQSADAPTVWLALATAIVAEIQTNGVVTTPLGVAVQVVPVTGTGATTAPGVGSIS